MTPSLRELNSEALDLCNLLERESDQQKLIRLVHDAYRRGREDRDQPIDQGALDELADWFRRPFSGSVSLADRPVARAKRRRP